jgi:hypothetical protein
MTLRRRGIGFENSANHEARQVIVRSAVEPHALARLSAPAPQARSFVLVAEGSALAGVNAAAPRISELS